jgi:asparagine synthase (glutamine-hydrolysing)
MCGIAGTYSINNKFSDSDIRKMTQRLKHRGPDADGVFISQHCNLGHTRLSIIDLSTNANQPMTSACGRYVIVYNGEVYNYNEIANELKYKTGINFTTNSDTEIILEAYSHYGDDFIHRLNGMFAIAIFDKEKRELKIYRDRLGIKPLHYYFDGKNFAFASEIKALKEIKSIALNINYNSIATFLNIGFVPQPESIYSEIKKLAPGSLLKFDGNSLEINKYWSIEEKVEKEIITDERKAIVLLSDLLASSVQYQLKSDVPFGIFLSGGIDSSLVSALAKQLSGTKINTFSIGFEEAKFNESDYAKSVANHLGTLHHELIVSYKNAINLIETYFDTYDEPFADSSGIPTLLVSKLAKQNVTVTLSGEGGDELFMGYGFYNWAERLNNPAIKLLKKSLRYGFSKMSNRFQRASHLFENNKNHFHSHIFSQEQYFFSEREIAELTTDKISFNTAISGQEYYLCQNNLKNKFSRKLDIKELQAIFDINYYLPQNLLTKVDRASMHYGLETRVPYLDHRVVECAINLEPDLKIKNGVQKYLLKQILYQYIPEKYFDRPKQGFSVPLSKWLKSDLNYLITDYLNEKVIRKHNVVHPQKVQELLNAYKNGKDYLYNRVWQLIVLHKWLEKHNG